jgi:outer membrane protein TolC
MPPERIRGIRPVDSTVRCRPECTVGLRQLSPRPTVGSGARGSGAAEYLEVPRPGAVVCSQFVVGATLKVPVLNPPLFSQLNDAAANLAGAQASEDIATQNIKLEVQLSFVNLVSARERFRTSEVLLIQVRENLALAQGRYQVAVVLLIDVTGAQLVFNQAESENIQAITDFKLSEARLRKAMCLVG